MINAESILASKIAEWHEAPEDERDLVARDMIYSLVKLIERAEKMHTLLARAHLKSLYAKWIQFCDQTEVDLGDSVERYDDALFGSAIITLNRGKGKAFVVKNKMLWSNSCIEQFTEWLNVSDDETSKHYKQWVEE